MNLAKLYTETIAATETKANPSALVVHKRVTRKRVARAVERAMRTLENPGFCIGCGAEAEGCEPDARGYTCERCGNATVYGAEELFLGFNLH